MGCVREKKKCLEKSVGFSSKLAFGAGFSQPVVWSLRSRVRQSNTDYLCTCPLRHISGNRDCPVSIFHKYKILADYIGLEGARLST